jgi:hypothetical protein
MAFDLSVRGAKQVSDGVWSATIEPAQLRIVGAAGSARGDVSVLLLARPPVFSREDRSLTFPLSDVHVLNVGATDQAVLVAAVAENASEKRMPESASRQSTDMAFSRSSPLANRSMTWPSTDESATFQGDKWFSEKLPRNLQALGDAFLKAVRSQFPGALVFHPRSAKFVESPDNFWTVRIQPRDQSLRITVRGVPESFTATKLIELKPDMGSYSAFKVSKLEQVKEAVEIIRQASVK